AEVMELLPDVPGQVLWLGSAHARQLTTGLEIEGTPARAIVLQGLLGHFQRPAEMLRGLTPYLSEGGWVIAVAAPRLNPMFQAGFTRAMLRDIFQRAGYDIGWLASVHDPRLPWRPPAAPA